MRETLGPNNKGGTTGNNWETSSNIKGPTVITKNGVEIEVPIEPGGVVEEAIKLGGKIVDFKKDISDQKN